MIGTVHTTSEIAPSKAAVPEERWATGVFFFSKSMEGFQLQLANPQGWSVLPDITVGLYLKAALGSHHCQYWVGCRRRQEVSLCSPAHWILQHAPGRLHPFTRNTGIPAKSVNLPLFLLNNLRVAAVCHHWQMFF